MIVLYKSGSNSNCGSPRHWAVCPNVTLSL